MTDFAKYISLNPEVRFGKPCISGARISVAGVLQRFASLFIIRTSKSRSSLFLHKELLNTAKEL